MASLFDTLLDPPTSVVPWEDVWGLGRAERQMLIERASSGLLKEPGPGLIDPGAFKQPDEVSMANARVRKLREYTPGQLTSMVKLRLRVGENTKLADVFNVHVLDNERVVAFICKNDRYVAIEDDVMFPSDAFITQVRLFLDTCEQ